MIMVMMIMGTTIVMVMAIARMVLVMMEAMGIL